MHLVVDPSKAGTILPRVVRAALKLFVEKGIDGTTTKDIAARARVSEGALYRHFKSKNALAWHIFSTHLGGFSRELLAVLSGEATARGRIRAYVAACFEAFESDRDLFTYLIVSEHREFTKLPADFTHPGQIAMQLVQDGQRKGELRPMDVRVAASILFGAVHRLCLTHIYNGLPGGLKKFAGEAAESVWRGLKK